MLGMNQPLYQLSYSAVIELPVWEHATLPLYRCGVLHLD